MVQALLLTDAAINLGLGLVLALTPVQLIGWLGLPEARPSFYARILGGVLFGIGLALLFETFAAGTGLGLAGALAINLSGAAVLAACLLFQVLTIPTRGRVLLWVLVALLVVLSAVEWAVAV